MSGTADLVAALQAASAAEQRAYFGYGLLGPRAGADHAAHTREYQAAHAALRDHLVADLLARHAAPDDPAADYGLTAPSTAAQAAGLAAQLEDGCAVAWRFVYATAATGEPALAADRAGAQRALIDSAVRAARWRIAAGDPVPTQPFPGR